MTDKYNPIIADLKSVIEKHESKLKVVEVLSVLQFVESFYRLQRVSEGVLNPKFKRKSK